MLLKKLKIHSGFTMLELIVVVVILGILATLGLSAYGGAQEQTRDREAKTNLKMIQAAQRVYAMEDPLNRYYDCGGCTTNQLNTRLKLHLTAETHWNYSVQVNNAPTPKVCCIQATRVNPPPGRARSWSLRMTEDEPPEPGTACP